VNIDYLRRLDRWAGVPLCRLLSLIPGSGAPPQGVPPVRRILVIMLSEMGSLVLAAPMFRELRKKFPNAALHALLFERNRELLDLLDVVPPGNIITIDDATAGSFLRGSLKAVRSMRRLGIDAVIDGELFTRVSSLFAYLSGAPLRVGFHRHTQEGLYRGDFINRPVLYNPYHHLSHQLLTLADAVGSETHPAGKRVVPAERPTVPPITFAEQELVAMQQRLSGDFPGFDLRKLVLLQPGGGALPIRAWPAGYYVRLGRGLIAAGYRLAIIGPPEDRAVARSILSAVGAADCIDLTGYTRTLRELLQLFHLAPLLIANDGGAAQFSALTPIQAVILFGPETPLLYGSLNPLAVSVSSSFSCSPCLSAYNHRKTPCDGDARCLKEISPELVLGEALKQLRP
jgi:ADP-heptose:LPS heptosyltransferase